VGEAQDSLSDEANKDLVGAHLRSGDRVERRLDEWAFEWVWKDCSSALRVDCLGELNWTLYSERPMRKEVEKSPTVTSAVGRFSCTVRCKMNGFSGV